MDDLISRQAAIDAILAINDYGNSDRANALGLAEFAITTLPVAQPEPIKIQIDHELTNDELERLRKDMADAPIVLMPSAQPEPKTGRWIPQNHNKVNGMASTLVYYYPKCSVCGHCAYPTNYCPNCGSYNGGGE